MTKTSIDFVGNLVEYFANGVTSEDFFKNVGLEETEDRLIILGDAQREWDGVDCEPEGCNSEDALELDIILDETEKELKAE